MTDLYIFLKNKKLSIASQKGHADDDHVPVAACSPTARLSERFTLRKKNYNLSWSLAGAVAALEYNSMLGLVLAYEVSSDHKMFGDFCIEIGQLVVQAADLEVEWRSKGAKNMCISSYEKIYHGPTGHQ